MRKSAPEICSDWLTLDSRHLVRNRIPIVGLCRSWHLRNGDDFRWWKLAAKIRVTIEDVPSRLK